LFEFLNPYKLLAANVSDEYVRCFVEDQQTLRETAWSNADELLPETSLSRVQRAVAEAAEASGQVLLELREQIAPDVATIACEAVCAPQSGKPHALCVLTEIFVVLRRHFLLDTEKMLVAYRRLALGFRFPTPHSLKHALF
jgi:hypothetical protein